MHTKFDGPRLTMDSTELSLSYHCREFAKKFHLPTHSMKNIAITTRKNNFHLHQNIEVKIMQQSMEGENSLGDILATWLCMQAHKFVEEK